jgi:uncharacterized repeat protein (TIGR03803 family)
VSLEQPSQRCTVSPAWTVTYRSRLVQAKNGRLYGTTYYGGANNDGEVFQITTAGKLKPLHSFCSTGDCADECALVFRAPNITSANVSITCKLPKRAEPYSVYSIDSPHDPVGRDFPDSPFHRLDHPGKGL